MKSDKVKFLLCTLFFIVLAAITFRCAWPADHVFSASDMNIGRLALKKHSLPAQLTGVFGSSPVLGGSMYRYMLFNVLTALFPLTVVANGFYGFALVVGSASMVWFLRMWERSWTASVLGALVAFWFNSIMLAAGGHAYKIEVLVFSVLALCFSEKAIRSVSLRKAVGFSLFTGIATGIMMIEQQDVALFAGLFVGSYTLFRLVQVHGKAFARWIAVLAPIASVALLLSADMVLKSYGRNISGAAAVQESNDDKWNYITQWSMVPDEWPDLVALGWSGWSSGNPDGPYWGKIGQSAEWETSGKGFHNFKLTSVYFGIIPFLLGGFGMVWAFLNRKSEEGRQILFWSIAGFLGFWLAFGKYSLLYKLFYQLPLVGNIRAPMKFMDNFQICLGIVAAYGLDRLVDDGKVGKITKVLWISGAVFGGLMLLAGLKLLVFPASQIAEFGKMGFEPYAEIMLKNMSNAWLHAALLAIVATGLVFVVWKGLKQAKWVAVAFVAVLAVDSLVQTSHYFRATNIASMKKGNVVLNFLKENQGNERTFLLDQGGIHNQWLASDGPYHEISFFNIWQYPRMPVEYKKFLSSVGRNQIRLWELSSVRYISAPAGVLEQFKKNPQLAEKFEPVLNYQVPTVQGMRPDVLLEFKDTIPRFAVFNGWDVLPVDQHCSRLSNPQHNVHATLLLTPGSGIDPQAAKSSFQSLDGRISNKDAVVNVEVNRPSIVRFSQRFQPEWRVYVDGEAAKLLQVDYLCMGVRVPSGKHEVKFKCVSGMPQALAALSVFVVSVVVAVGLLRRTGSR